jgi:HPt (histidine-containing phosphotransfer) domain-containing protein
MTATHMQADLSRCPSRGRPIDLVHLARQTGGSQSLELEVLGIMARQIGDALTVSDHPDARTDLRSLAHGVCGAARNLGAFPLAQAARDLEANPSDRNALVGFRHELQRALVFIRALTVMEDHVDARRRAH